jgi:hypothetical protein
MPPTSARHRAARITKNKKARPADVDMLVLRLPPDIMIKLRALAMVRRSSKARVLRGALRLYERFIHHTLDK